MKAKATGRCQLRKGWDADSIAERIATLTVFNSTTGRGNAHG